MTDPVTETRGLLDAATPGPWHWDTHPRSPELLGVGGTPGRYTYETPVLEATHDGGCGCRRSCDLELEVNPEDMRLIAASPRLLAALCDRIEELETGIREHRDKPHGAPVVSWDCDEELWALVDRDGTNTEQDPTTT